MPQDKISRDKSIKRTKVMTELIISLVLVGSIGYLVKGSFDRLRPVEQSPYFDNTEIPEIEPTDIDPNQTIYESFSVATKDKFKGDLILVNEDHQYFGGDEDLVSIVEMNLEAERSSFTAVDNTYTILRRVYGPMADMIDDFYKKYDNDTLIIYGSYRTTAFQQQLYEQDLAQTGNDESTRVAKPGFSEHETGYAFDFTESVNHDYDGTGDFAWINKNCYKYGFVVRYTKSKEKITKIQDEPWHFRYVGIPHAYYMTKNNLCLEEYIALLESHPYDGEHLEFSDDDGNEYEVYFVASDDGAENTSVPVPSGVKYEISGNNSTGFIVTVYKGQAPEIPEATTEDNTDDDGYDDDEDGGEDDTDDTSEY